MTNIDHGLTGRDVIAKTFSTRTRRGYDPIEVDAYLEQLATHIDNLLSEVDRLEAERVDFSSAPPPPPPPSAVAAYDASSDLAPPTVAADIEEEVESPAVPATTDVGSEAAELVLRMAQKASTDTLEEAKNRADEIVADAEFKASEIQREADRKAFDVSSRTQGELRSVEVEIESRKGELDTIRGAIMSQRNRLRSLGQEITTLAEGIEVGEQQAAVLDLSDDAVTVNAEAEAADIN